MEARPAHPAGSERERESKKPPSVPDHELLRCIGQGSYGDVWLARNVLGQFRAVKVVHRATFEDDRPFEREFEGIKKFEPISRSHPSQLNILHVGRGEGYFHYVMELADDAADGVSILDPGHSTLGGHPASRIQNPKSYVPRTLKSELKRCGRLPPAECVEIGLALTTALAHLHEHDLVHRDIKPSNIIFVGGVPKLADIGLVTDVDASRSFVGTEGFLPPEGPGTPQADLYSLGKVLYEMSTGRDRKDYPALPLDWDGLDPAEQARLLELNEVLVKVCEADPRRRYQSADELHADLLLLDRGESVRRKRARERRLSGAKYAALASGGIIALVCLTLAITKDLIREGIGEASTTPSVKTADRQKAQQLYMQGILDGGHFTKERFTRSIEYLNQALELDPSLAAAYEALAELYRQASEWHLPPKQAMSEAKKNIRRALTLNNNSASAHLTLGWIYMHHGWDWTAAEREFRQALALAPTDPMPHCDLAWYLRLRGRLQEAAAFQKTAQALGQSNFPVNVATAWQYCLEQRYDEAEKACDDLKRLHADKEILDFWLARIYERLGRYGEAEGHLRALRAVDDAPDVMGFLGHLYGIVGRHAEASGLLKDLEASGRSRYVSPYFAAIIYAGIGAKEEALNGLEKACEARSANLVDLKMEPRWDPFRSDIRFQNILKKVGLD